MGIVKATLAPACPFKILLYSKAEKVSFKHDYLEALDRKKSIFDIMILFQLRTIIHQENTKQLYQKLPPPLYRNTQHHPAQRIWTCISKYQSQQQWGSQYLFFSELWHDKCWRVATDIKTDQQDHSWREEEVENQDKSSKYYMYGMLLYALFIQSLKKHLLKSSNPIFNTAVCSCSSVTLVHSKNQYSYWRLISITFWKRSKAASAVSASKTPQKKKDRK